VFDQNFEPNTKQDYPAEKLCPLAEERAAFLTDCGADHA
jgi:rubredoxin